MTDKAIKFECKKDCKKKNTSECYELNCIEGQTNVLEQLSRKTAECEELKAQLETYSKMLDNPEFKIALTDVRTGEREVWRKLGNKAQRYEQALDAIEKELKECVYCESQECACDDFEECLKCTKEHILDFISKAKDINVPHKKDGKNE